MAADKKVRIYLGTRKGGYVAESDAKRAKWTVRGPFQPGSDVFHVMPDPRNPGLVYSLANSGWFGPRLFRSKDYGRKWTEIAPPLMPKGSDRPAPNMDDGPPTKGQPIVNLWHLEPGHASEPKSVFIGVDPASLYRSDNLGDAWSPISALNEHESRPKWNPGAGGMCLHTILIDPNNPRRMHVGISAAGTFRTDDGGEHWKPTNRGVVADFMPDKNPEVGQCVHKVCFEPSNSQTLYRQDHGGIYVSHDASDSWQRVGKPLPEDFGFVVAAAPAMPRGAFFVPLQGEARVALGGQLQIYRWNDQSRKWSGTVKGKPWPGELGTHREALTTDTLDPAGVYLGTTSGALIYSNDGARSYREIPYRFPAIHSVEVLSPSAGR